MNRKRRLRCANAEIRASLLTMRPEAYCAVAMRFVNEPLECGKNCPSFRARKEG